MVMFALLLVLPVLQRYVYGPSPPAWDMEKMFVVQLVNL